MTREVILSVQDLDVKFRLRGKVLHAIRGISLDIYKGESLAIVGESGSGKSVFTKTFMGLLDNNGFIPAGHIMYDGKDLAKITAEKGLKLLDAKLLCLRLKGYGSSAENISILS